MPSKFLAKCLDCGYEAPYDMHAPACSKCGSAWREAQYDFSTIGKELPEKLLHRPFNLWRYHELLPTQSSLPDISLGEGGTPLIRATNLGMMLGCKNLFIKDERQSPTNSFKDRQAAVTIAALKEADITEMVAASTGNVAISYSAYAARAGIKLWAFLTSRVPADKMREVALYGTQVVKVTGSYDQTKKIASQFAEQRKVFYDLGARSIPCIEGMKTIAFEVAEQLTKLFPMGDETNTADKAKWQVPDWYIQSVSGGMGPLGVLKGFKELQKMGLTDRMPKAGVIQAEGCAPMVHAWKQGLDTAVPVRSPKTHIETLATGDPGRTYTLLKEKMLADSGGIFESVTDEETFRAIHFMAKMEGISVEPAAAVAVAGLIKLVRSGVIKPDDVVVLNCTGHTLAIENSILGEGWSRDIDISQPSNKQTEEEGLLAALSHVAPDRYPRVAIVDDSIEARRLIRRILQSQGEYTIFEASNGRDAVEMIQRELPNLIILDLMMPEIDGFGVLQKLQTKPETVDIPVIVVTAKELTSDEKKLLEGRVKSLLQKGDFMNDQLEDEIRSLLG